MQSWRKELAEIKLCETTFRTNINLSKSVLVASPRLSHEEDQRIKDYLTFYDHEQQTHSQR